MPDGTRTLQIGDLCTEPLDFGHQLVKPARGVVVARVRQSVLIDKPPQVARTRPRPTRNITPCDRRQQGATIHTQSLSSLAERNRGPRRLRLARHADRRVLPPAVSSHDPLLQVDTMIKFPKPSPLSVPPDRDTNRHRI